MELRVVGGETLFLQKIASNANIGINYIFVGGLLITHRSASTSGMEKKFLKKTILSKKYSTQCHCYVYFFTKCIVRFY